MLFFQEITTDAIDELERKVFDNIENYIYYSDYVRDPATQHTKKEFKTGDRYFLKVLPKILKDLEQKGNEDLAKLKKRKATYYTGMKRKSQELNEDCELINVTETENSEPIRKKAKLTVDTSIINSSFKAFYSGIFTNETNKFEFNENAQRFFVNCSQCNKAISVGFKVSKRGAPIFSNTNLKRHAHFNSFFKPKSNPNSVGLEMIGTDSGLGEDIVLEIVEASDLNSEFIYVTNES